MADDPPRLVQIYLTIDPLFSGEVHESWGRIEGDVVVYGAFNYQTAGEGKLWHRTRWAAENYARQLQAERLAELRAEVTRIEGFRFGRRGS